MKGETPDRVLMLLENGSFIGDIRVNHEAKALAAAGYKVSVVCARRERRPWRETIEGIHVYRFPKPSGGDSLIGYAIEYGYAMFVIFLLSLVVLVCEGFDVIHAHCPPDTFSIIAAFYKLLGKRFVFDHHDLAPEMYFYARFRNGGNRFIYQLLIWFEKLSCRLADRVIATNESYKNIEVERGGAQEDRVIIVRNGPDLELLSPIAPDPDLRKRAGTILGYVGAMGPQDGVDYLIRSIHHLVFDLDVKDVYCVIIGRGKALPSLQEITKELSLEEFIWFTGWIPNEDKLRYLATADICIDPDPSNPFNDRCTMIKILEYMALGKPTVAFDLPEHRVSANSAALYAQPNDELDFAKKIVTLINDPSQRQRMGESGRKRIKSGLAWPFQAEKLVRAYSGLFEESD